MSSSNATNISNKASHAKNKKEKTNEPEAEVKEQELHPVPALFSEIVDKAISEIVVTTDQGEKKQVECSDHSRKILSAGACSLAQFMIRNIIEKAYEEDKTKIDDELILRVLFREVPSDIRNHLLNSFNSDANNDYNLFLSYAPQTKASQNRKKQKEEEEEKKAEAKAKVDAEGEEEEEEGEEEEEE